MTLPALSESSSLRFATLAMLYVAQGIPDAMVLIIFPAYLAAQGVSPAEIGGFLALAMAPNSAKLISGPLIDRFSFLPMGRRKPWVMLGQLGIAAAFIFLTFLGDPAEQLFLFGAGAFAITLATVFQDVATDGMAMDLVPVEEQGKANGLMWGGKTLGTAIAASAGAAILAAAGFGLMVGTMALVLLAVLAAFILFRERPGERLMPWSKGSSSPESLNRKVDDWRSLVVQLFAAIRRPAAIRLIGISISIGLIAGLSGAMLPALFVQQFGWTNGDYSQLRSVLKLVAGIAGMVAGGFLVDKIGQRRMLWLLFGAMALASATLAGSLGLDVGAYFIAAYEVLLVFIFIAFFAATMHQCWPQIAATQFSFTMVCGNMALVVGAASLGPIEGAAGYQGVLGALATLCLVAAAIATSIRFDDRQQA